MAMEKKHQFNSEAYLTSFITRPLASRIGL